MQIVICDDDSRISAVLAEKVGKLYPDSEISTVNSGEELVAFIGNTSPDIVLLDIQMTGMDGMETARKLRADGCESVIIFVTGVSDYVFDAFDVRAFHYLIKPVSDEKLKDVLEKAEASLLGQNSKEKATDNDRYFTIQSGGSHIRVPLGTIVYAEVFNRRVVLHTTQESIEYYGKLSDLEKMAGKDFFRTHRGYLVHLKYVEKYDAGEVILPDGRALIARQNYAPFVKAYLDYHKRIKSGH